MKRIIRSFLINLIALYATSQVIPGLVLQGGIRSLITGALAFMVINALIVPILKIMFLPLNLLTLGFFSWAVNVLALFFLTAMVPQFKIVPYTYTGLDLKGLIIPTVELNTLYVAILASFLIGFTIHLLHWLVK